MTIGAPELLRGNAASLATPPPAECAGDFMAGMLGAVALVSILAAQEAETAAATRLQENATMRAIFAETLAAGLAGSLATELTAAAQAADTDLTLTALDAVNARLRTALIALQCHAEAENLIALQRQILRVLRSAAEARVLVLPE